MFVVVITLSFQFLVRAIDTPTSCVRQWAIIGACSVLCYLFGRVGVLVAHYHLFLFSNVYYCRRDHHEVIVYPVKALGYHWNTRYFIHYAQSITGYLSEKVTYWLFKIFEIQKGRTFSFNDISRLCTIAVNIAIRIRA